MAKEYPRDIDAELKDMFYNRVREVKEEAMKISTQTRVKIDTLVEKVKEHDGLFAGLFKAMTASFGGMMRLDEKLKGKK